jgi:transcriptional regulator with XRE-family HTH domain
VIGNYGKKIRFLRIAQKMTLLELGVAAGISASYVSQIERGQSSVSLTTLVQIARSLGVSVEYLLYDAGDYINTPGNVTSRFVCPSGKPYYFKILSNDVGEKKLRIYQITFLPGSKDYSLPIEDKEGFLYMLRGVLTIEINHKTELMFHGDSLFFDGSVEYKFFNRSDGIIVLIYATFASSVLEKD